MLISRKVLARPFLSVLALTVVLHVVLFAFVFPKGFGVVHSTDGAQYLTMAENLLAGRGFSLHREAPYVPDSIRTPLYPVFLAAVHRVTGSFELSLWITMLLGCLIPLCGMRVMAALTDDRRLWVLAGVILAIDPNVWYYSFIYGSEGIVLPFMAVSVAATTWMFVKPTVPRALLSGALLGLAALGRPIVQFVPFLLIVFAIVDVIKKRHIRTTLVKSTIGFCLAYALIVSPWLLRNHRLFGTWEFSNVGWFNMYTRVAATAESIHTGASYDATRRSYLERLHTLGYVDHANVTEEDVHAFTFRPIFIKETIATIKAYPREFVISQVSAFFTVISQDVTIRILQELNVVHATNWSFSPTVVLLQQGVGPFFRQLGGFLFTPWLMAIVMRFVWFACFVALCVSPFVRSKGERPSRALVWFLTLYSLAIIALSLNAAAQAASRYRSQYLVAQTPLVLYALSAFRRRRKTLEEQSPSCPVCHTTSWVRAFGMKRGYPLYRCSFCHTVFVSPMPSAETIAAFYSRAYFFGGHTHGGYADYDKDKQASHETFDDILNKLDGVGAHGRLLDVGAATGVFLDAARSRGWAVYGQELSEDAGVVARSKGLLVTTQPLESAELRSQSFDAITLLDVIEHVPSPDALIHALTPLLAPHGVLVVNTPDAGSVMARLLGSRWHALTPPEHLVVFSQRSLVLLLERSGFEVTWVGRIAKRFRLSYVAHTLGHWLGWKFPGRFASWLEQHSRWNVALALPIRDNIAVMARRPNA